MQPIWMSTPSADTNRSPHRQELHNIARMNRYTLNGKPLGKDHSTGLVAMNAAASLAATPPRVRQFVGALWNLPILTHRYRYYDGMLYLMTLHYCSSEFYIYSPCSLPSGVQRKKRTGETL